MKVLSCIAACLVTVSLVAPLATALAVCFTSSEKRDHHYTYPKPSALPIVTEQPDAFTLMTDRVMTISDWERRSKRSPGCASLCVWCLQIHLENK